MINTILLDMDGVLIDACEIHRRCFAEAVAPYNPRAYTDKELEGLPTKTKLERLGIGPASAAQIQRAKQEATLRAAYKYKPDWARGDVLYELKRRGFRLGCVTNSIRRTTLSFLQNSRLLQYLDTVVTNEDVIFPKPSPEGYVVGMRELKSKPAQTLIVEDSPVGLEAARCSGAYVLETTFETLSLERILEAVAKAEADQ